MNMPRIAFPPMAIPSESCLPLALAAVAALLCLWLILCLRAQARAARRRREAQAEELRAGAKAARETVESLRASLEQLEASVREIREWGAPQQPAARAALNGSVRSQVLRRRRLGEDPGEIARALGVPRAEIDLLIKVHALLLAALPGGAPATRPPSGAAV